MTSQEAVQLVRDVLFENANRLYQLGLEFRGLETSGVGLEAPHQSRSPSRDGEIVRKFLHDENQPQPDFVRINWLDYNGLTA